MVVVMYAPDHILDFGGGHFAVVVVRELQK